MNRRMLCLRLSVKYLCCCGLILCVRLIKLRENWALLRFQSMFSKRRSIFLPEYQTHVDDNGRIYHRDLVEVRDAIMAGKLNGFILQGQHCNQLLFDLACKQPPDDADGNEY